MTEIAVDRNERLRLRNEKEMKMLRNEADVCRVESSCCHQMEPAGSRLNLRLLLDASGSGGLRHTQARQRQRCDDDLSLSTTMSNNRVM
jgi:hypothetical protein